MNEHFDFRNESFSDNEKEIDKQLRPLEFDDFSGQNKIVENLKIFVKAAKMRGEAQAVCQKDRFAFHPSHVSKARSELGMRTKDSRAR